MDIEINKQGGPVVNWAETVTGNKVLAVSVDLKTKRCTVSGIGDNDGIPVIYIEPAEGSLYLHETETGETAIAFPELKGWKVWSAHSSRYTVYVCLITEEIEE